MRTSLFDYKLPQALIANSPASPRDCSRLMVIDRKNKSIQHKIFKNLADLLTDNDVLVFNNSKVFPARLLGRKDTGGKIEILLLSDLGNGIWLAMHKGKVKRDQKLIFNDLSAEIININEELVEIKFTDKNYWQKILEIGQTPLPPYIKSNEPENSLRQKYQTIYAKPIGSAAAPTAGLHFTHDLLNKLKKKGVQLEYVTLHVGLGTFAAVKTTELTKHKMHSEHYEVSQSLITQVSDAKQKGKRIIAVGTTTVRVLETIAQTNKLQGLTDIFIYPPYKFNFIDGLITNFHLPQSTLLALVAAFTSYPNTNNKFTDFKKNLIGYAYQEAILNNYHFYSFGDAMLIN